MRGHKFKAIRARVDDLYQCDEMLEAVDMPEATYEPLTERKPDVWPAPCAGIAVGVKEENGQPRADGATFNNAFTLTFEVDASMKADGSDVTPERLYWAIINRASTLFDAGTLKQEIGFPYDSCEEEQEVEVSGPTI